MGKLLCEKNLRDVWCRNESVRAEIGQILHTHTHTRARARVTVTVFKTSRHSKLLFFVKKQRTMGCKKQSKGRGWESCYVKKIYGTFGVEMRAYGQKFVTFCTHTRARLTVTVFKTSRHSKLFFS